MENLNFHIITPFKGPKEWLDDCIASVRNQTLPNIHHVIIDTDNKGACRNHFEALQKIEPVSTNIIIHLDGDDMFLGTKVLETLKEVYENNLIWLTYGNYVSRTGSICKPNDVYPYRDHFLRTGDWRWSHLRTFRAHLIPYLREEDMKDSADNWISAAPDVAIFLPLLELCGQERVKFIDKELVYYRLHNNNEHSTMEKAHDQYRCAREIAFKKPYSKLI